MLPFSAGNSIRMPFQTKLIIRANTDRIETSFIVKQLSLDAAYATGVNGLLYDRGARMLEHGYGSNVSDIWI